MPVDPTNAMTLEIPEAVSAGLMSELWRRRWVMAGFLIASLVVGLYIASRSRPVYSSSCRLLFDQRTGTGSTVASDDYVRSQALEIKSSAVLNDAVLTLSNQRMPALQSGDVYGLITQALTAAAGRGDGVLTVSFMGPIASENAAILNAVVDSYQRYQARQFTSGTADLLKLLFNERDRINLLLVEKQEKAKDSKIHHLADSPAAVELEKQQLLILSNQLAEAKGSEITLAAKCDALVLQYPGESVKNDNDSNLDPAWIQNEMSLASSNLDVLKSRGLPDNNPSVQDARASLQKLEKQLALCRLKAGFSLVTQAQRDLDVASRKTAKLQTAYEVQRKSLLELSERATEAAALQEDADRTGRSADVISERIKQLNLDQSVPINVHVLEDARTTTKSIDTRSGILLRAGSVGLAVGLTVSLLLCATDQRLRSMGRIRTVLRLPVLGVIPNLPNSPSTAFCGLMTHSNPMSGFAEAARAVRSAVFFAGRSASARTILVASASDRDGRSIVATNLAIAMAQAGSRTLLVDTDFRNPTMPAIFDIMRPTGLSDVLSGKLTLDRAINRTPIERFEVLTGGLLPRSPADLLNSAGFSRLIKQLESKYQCIVFDSPPVTGRADALILAASADLTLFVVRTGRTREAVADSALQQLLSVGARVLGIVVNDVTLSKPLVRSRGVLQYVELPQTGLAQADISNHAMPEPAQNQPRENMFQQKSRMGTKSLPDVEVFD